MPSSRPCSPTLPLSNAVIASRTSGSSTVSDRPLVTISTSPRMAVSVPSVTMNALMPRYCTMAPFSTPTAPAAASATTTDGQKPIWPQTLIITAAASAATDATDRSKLPVIRITVIATPMIEISDD